MLAGCLFPGEGHDGILCITFGMPGLDLKPGTPVPAGPALSEARALPGEQVARRAFELDAARADVDLGIGATWHDLETTAFDGTTAELFSNDVLAGEFGVPAGGTKPKARIVGHVRTGSRRWDRRLAPLLACRFEAYSQARRVRHALGGERGGDRLPAAGAD